LKKGGFEGRTLKEEDLKEGGIEGRRWSMDGII
jgi:hypothetical protein